MTEAGAAADYGVVVTMDGRDAIVDPDATEALRLGRRRERIGGGEPRPALAEPPAGRRVSSAVAIVDGTFTCRRCGHAHGPADRPLEDGLVGNDAPVDERNAWAGLRESHTRFAIRRWWCGGCGLQVDVAVTLR